MEHIHPQLSSTPRTVPLVFSNPDRDGIVHESFVESCGNTRKDVILKYIVPSHLLKVIRRTVFGGITTVSFPLHDESVFIIGADRMVTPILRIDNVQERRLPKRPCVTDVHPTSSFYFFATSSHTVFSG